ncbi:MAG: TrkH family potassium uptake protein [Candidatus Nanohaloarchaea archaeon]
MRNSVIFQLVGTFLVVFSLVLLVPLGVAFYYQETLYHMAGYVVASIASFVLGYLARLSAGEEGKRDPTILEAMFATVLGWTLATSFAALPFLTYMGMMDAFFEAAAGLTTTGISMFLEPEALPRSLLFWRSFMQWVGGLGILTFFIAVIRESGGISRKLFSAEAHKTDPGSIRPSLTKSIFALWKVYGFMTILITATYIALGVPYFDAFLHAFSAISTGGFSTMGASIAGFDSQAVELATTVFMFIGGVNFVLLYRALQGEMSPMLDNSEFKLYFKIFSLVTGLMAIELLFKGMAPVNALLDSMFQSAAVVSSTGYSTMSLMSLSVALQAVFIAVMFVGGSLGSTAGGLKMFRLKAMMELLKTRIRAYSLPETAINEVELDGQILEKSTVRTIAVLFFAWTGTVFIATLFVLALEDISFMAALSGSVSSAGNMGPVYLAGEKLVSLNPGVKLVWLIVMLAGRLEMLPVLAIFNSDLFKDSQ